MAYLSQLRGTLDNGETKAVPCTQEGHLEVEIHGPLNPFGSVHTEAYTSIFQADAIYGLNSFEMDATTGLGYDPGPGAPGANSGSAVGANGLFTCSTGTTAFSFGTIQTRKRLRYRPGQGIIGRFTALWSTPAASTIVVAGFGSSESGYYFGYSGTTFGLLHSTGNVREIQTFTVTAAATVGGAVTFVLNGLSYAQTLAASATTTLTANNIASKTFSGWSVEARGATVVFLADSAGNKAGTFSVTPGGSGLTGTYAETLAGSTTADTFIAQSSWNGDKCDGTGASGFTLNPAKGNVFQIGIAWLGFGPVTFSILMPSAEGNNANWAVVHTINNPNARTTTHTNQPSFPFTMAAYSSGSTTNVSVSCASLAGFVEGAKRTTGPRMTYWNTTAVTSSTSAYIPILSVRNDLVYATRASQTVVNLLSFGGSANGNANANTSFFLIRSATLTGPVSWTAWASTSCTYADTGATGCSFSSNDQVIWTGSISQAGEFVFAFEDDITLQPGETVTLAVRSATSTAVCLAQLNTREDQ